MHRFVLLVLVLGSLALSACDRRPGAAPASNQPSAPRVVAHSPAVGVIIDDLGLTSLVVARHGHDLVLPRSLPIVGTQEGFDYEALITARPTHIITQWGSRELPARLVELAHQNDWKLLDTRLLSLEDIRKDTLAIDTLLCEAEHQTPPSAAGSALIQRMNKAWSKRADGFADLGKVLLLASTSPPAAFGPGSCHHDILQRIGATPAITEGNAYIELDPERLLRMQPDVIILVSPRGYGTPEPSPDDQQTQLAQKFEGLSRLKIPAAAHRRFAIIDDPLCQLPSSSMIRFADDLVSTLEQLRLSPAKP